MANVAKRVRENVPGDFFVDSTCIDCDACRQVAPSVFAEAAETAFVHKQPVDRLLLAHVAQPTLNRTTTDWVDLPVRGARWLSRSTS